MPAWHACPFRRTHKNCVCNWACDCKWLANRQFPWKRYLLINLIAFPDSSMWSVRYPCRLWRKELVNFWLSLGANKNWPSYKYLGLVLLFICSCVCNRRQLLLLLLPFLPLASDDGMPLRWNCKLGASSLDLETNQNRTTHKKSGSLYIFLKSKCPLFAHQRRWLLLLPIQPAAAWFCWLSGLVFGQSCRQAFFVVLPASGSCSCSCCCCCSNVINLAGGLRALTSQHDARFEL